MMAIPEHHIRRMQKDIEALKAGGGGANYNFPLLPLPKA
jgi:hypothetical protein